MISYATNIVGFNDMRVMAAENARLKNLIAEQALAIEVLTEVNAKKW
jgi:hypothetical protein